MLLSVVIRTHNQKPEYLRRVLDALKAQTLPKEQWELLIVDNASKEPVAAAWDLSWHPHSRHVREDEVGARPALLRGIRESTGEYLVTVDDDNVLAANYLAEIVSIIHRMPMLGAIGAGVGKGEFEILPPDWITPYLCGLAVDSIDRDCWSNSDDWTWRTPYGAGMCVRRDVAEDFAQKVTNSPMRRLLGRSGSNMTPGEDTDLALCAVDVGLGTGRFLSLEFTHLIPKNRLTQDYILRLFSGFAAVDEILPVIRGKAPANPPFSWKKQIRFLINLYKRKGFSRSVFLAEAKARKEAKRQVAAVLADRKK